jgi:hypothetical protein
MTVAAAGDIYRCTGSAGEPVFSGRPCADGHGTRVILPPGGDPVGSGLRASESAWLAERAAARRGQRRPRPAAPRHAEADSDRQAYRCREKRRQLDSVKRRLRQGYKPSQGESLRLRRSRYADYLSTFCS